MRTDNDIVNYQILVCKKQITNPLKAPFLVCMYLKQKRSKTRTNDDRRNALLWEIKARETDDVKRKCQYYYCCDIHYFYKEQIKLLHIWQSKAPRYIR